MALGPSSKHTKNHTPFLPKPLRKSEAASHISTPNRHHHTVPITHNTFIHTKNYYKKQKQKTNMKARVTPGRKKVQLRINKNQKESETRRNFKSGLRREKTMTMMVSK